jgi:hypothetical protein
MVAYFGSTHPARMSQNGDNLLEPICIWEVKVRS